MFYVRTLPGSFLSERPGFVRASFCMTEADGRGKGIFCVAQVDKKRKETVVGRSLQGSGADRHSVIDRRDKVSRVRWGTSWI